jgi:hypothetical protein
VRLLQAARPVSGFCTYRALRPHKNRNDYFLTATRDKSASTVHTISWGNAVTRPMAFERVRWLFFWLAIRVLATAALFLSTAVIFLSAYGLFRSEQTMVWIVIGTPSVFMFVSAIKLIRGWNFSPDEVNAWYSGGKEK